MCTIVHERWNMTNFGDATFGGSAKWAPTNLKFGTAPAKRGKF